MIQAFPKKKLSNSHQLFRCKIVYFYILL